MINGTRRDDFFFFFWQQKRKKGSLVPCQRGPCAKRCGQQVSGSSLTLADPPSCRLPFPLTCHSRSASPIYIPASLCYRSYHHSFPSLAVLILASVSPCSLSSQVSHILSFPLSNFLQSVVLFVIVYMSILSLLFPYFSFPNLCTVLISFLR